ncbi:hypothetical protein [Actinomyces culturomici]|uniref:hypothetical protein n=1 Tax=Actinomyces culturomici TaxID=1926276 RepID=UPI000E200708|nr:hypothetical protein [Actinomyces culturomici]
MGVLGDASSLFALRPVLAVPSSAVCEPRGDVALLLEGRAPAIALDAAGALLPSPRLLIDEDGAPSWDLPDGTAHAALLVVSAKVGGRWFCCEEVDGRPDLLRLLPWSDYSGGLLDHAPATLEALGFGPRPGVRRSGEAFPSAADGARTAAGRDVVVDRSRVEALRLRLLRGSVWDRDNPAIDVPTDFRMSDLPVHARRVLGVLTGAVPDAIDEAAWTLAGRLPAGSIASAPLALSVADSIPMGSSSDALGLPDSPLASHPGKAWTSDLVPHPADGAAGPTVRLRLAVRVRGGWWLANGAGAGRYHVYPLEVEEHRPATGAEMERVGIRPASAHSDAVGLVRSGVEAVRVDAVDPADRILASRSLGVGEDLGDFASIPDHAVLLTEAFRALAARPAAAGA